MLSKEVAVVGAEIVGLSVAYALVRIGASATVIDRNANCGNASSGNAGVDPGSLEERSRMAPGSSRAPWRYARGMRFGCFHGWPPSRAPAVLSQCHGFPGHWLRSMSAPYDDLAALLRHTRGSAPH
ncbi:FAD-dependent oxidoreductase [Rhizobium laguerreae]|uniref:FAD-dependent oxidoreductase n=1 Tax=Rhizobium laguerreae TaxID=1076926 RepID=UPI0028B1E210|nr:FAD-dependent oxidoreductase [Rhizobium laguerreae]